MRNFAVLNAAITLVTSIVIIGCEHEVSVNSFFRLAAGDEANYRLIAWNFLGARERSTVIGDQHSGRVKPDKWQEKDVVSVTFNTTEDDLLGPIVIYINPQSKTVVGRAGRF